MKYGIEIDYTTGDSLGSERCKDEIPKYWESKELARKALKSIKEHYEFYKEKDGWGSRRTNEQIFKDVKKHEWNNMIPKEYWEQYIAVEMDNGKWETIYTSMWIGYFESLHGARIIIVDGSDDEDSFEIN